MATCKNRYSRFAMEGHKSWGTARHTANHTQEALAKAAKGPTDTQHRILFSAARGFESADTPRAHGQHWQHMGCRRRSLLATRAKTQTKKHKQQQKKELIHNFSLISFMPGQENVCFIYNVDPRTTLYILSLTASFSNMANGQRNGLICDIKRFSTEVKDSKESTY